jgi:beta-lactamase superfamily II metal-dependent hydrolase
MVFINRLLMGDTSGSQQYDLLRYISKKNGQNFKYTPVNQGSIIRFGSAELMVLWPPDNISSGRFNRAVDTTLNRFEEFIAKNGKLRARYERMNEIPSEPGTFAADDDDQIALEMTNEKLVKEVHRINTALNDIANRISLAFIIKDSILFLGDLLEPELNEVIKHLKHSYRFNHIDCLVAAHHGTHWDNSLYDIFAYQVAISNGKRMICKFREEYKDIAEGIRSTFQEGDISIDLRLRLTSRWS